MKLRSLRRHSVKSQHSAGRQNDQQTKMYAGNYRSSNRRGSIDMIIPHLAYLKPGPSYHAILSDSSLFEEPSTIRPSTVAVKQRRRTPEIKKQPERLSKYLSDFSTSKIPNLPTQRQKGHSLQLFSNQNIKTVSTFKRKATVSIIKEESQNNIQQTTKERQRGRNVEFILKRKQQGGVGFSEGMRQYCSRMKMDENSRIFVFQSSDEHIKQALLKRGWVENRDPQSMCFHLKWSVKVDGAAIKKLGQKQLYNHFEESDLLTSKEGLMKVARPCRELRKSVPRAFDLGSERQQFIDNFMQTGVLCGLKKIAAYLLQMGSEKLWQIEPCKLKQYFQVMIAQNDYLASQKCDLSVSAILHIPYCVQILAVCENLRCKLEGDRLSHSNVLHIKTLRNILSYSKLAPPYHEYMKPASQPNLHKIIFSQQDINRFSVSGPSFGEPSSVMKALLVAYHAYFSKNLDTYAVEGTRNVWIVKSRNGSKGVGMSLLQNLEGILKISENKLVQKYIEDCVTYNAGINHNCFSSQQKRKQSYKFDLRIWVLVQRLAPLTAYFYQDYYCRVCPCKYDLSDLNNRQAHLTNFSINYSHSHYQEEHIEKSVISKKAMLENVCAQQASRAKNNWTEKDTNRLGQQLDKKLATLIRNTLLQYAGLFSSQHSKKNCFELYGFDILLSHDEESLRAHLLEVNLSPACKQRAEWLSDDLRNMSQSLLDIILNERKDSLQTTCDYHGWLSL